jgi:uncharacterized UPF0160 family protein
MKNKCLDNSLKSKKTVQETFVTCLKYIYQESKAKLNKLTPQILNNEILLCDQRNSFLKMLNFCKILFLLARNIPRKALRLEIDQEKQNIAFLLFDSDQRWQVSFMSDDHLTLYLSRQDMWHSNIK